MATEDSGSFWSDMIFKKKPIRNKQGGEGGAGDLYSNAVPVTESLAAWKAADAGMAYAPANSHAVQALANVAHAINAQNGNDIAPSPMGASFPDLQRDSAWGDEQLSPQELVQNPNRKVVGKASGNRREVVLKANYNNAYMVQGHINGKAVDFLVDTGATQVSIPRRVADAIGLKPSGRKSQAQTANGLVTIYETHLDTLTIGPIELQSISASINMGDRSEQILLGMSVLSQLEVIQKGGQLWLRQG